MNLEAYARFCGPRALAALAHIELFTAAHELRNLGGGIDGGGTSVRALATALTARGYRIERWSVAPHGWRTTGSILERCDADDVAVAELRALVIEPPPAVPMEHRALVDDILARRSSISSARTARRRVASLTVREWLRRFEIGSWVLNAPGHWLAARAGSIVAGDDPDATEYGARELEDAWRVYPQDGIWRVRVRRLRR